MVSLPAAGRFILPALIYIVLKYPLIGINDLPVPCLEQRQNWETLLLLVPNLLEGRRHAVRKLVMQLRKEIVIVCRDK